MKRIALALALALLPGLAAAQNITRSLQGSQDPRGPVGIDTSNSVYFQNHINAFNNTTARPSVACTVGGTPAIGTNSVDAAGTFTSPGGACTVTFGSPFNAVPPCIVQNTSMAAATTLTISFNVVSLNTTSFTYTNATSGGVVNWVCIGNQ